MNNPHEFWQPVLASLQAGEHGVLMVVTESLGSSPGRAGFKMFVTATGAMHGTIGGGSMEHKLVELARSLMDKPSEFPFQKRQVHREGEARDRSGMICSGEQMVAFHRLDRNDLKLLEKLADPENDAGSVVYHAQGIDLRDRGSTADHPAGWYMERLCSRPRIAIIGGGHVGLALSRTMHQLGFHVMQFDHRDELNTMGTNAWAHEKKVVDFEHIEKFVPEDPELFIALVSHGYRTDEIALRRLIRRKWAYLGMLGSKAKVEAIWSRLRADGFTDDELARVHAPIGIAINSRTPEEIAVSIAAEIIRIRNI